MCVLAVCNKEQAQIILKREFKLWAILQGTENRVATFHLSLSLSLYIYIYIYIYICVCVCVCVRVLHIFCLLMIVFSVNYTTIEDDY